MDRVSHMLPVTAERMISIYGRQKQSCGRGFSLLDFHHAVCEVFHGGSVIVDTERLVQMMKELGFTQCVIMAAAIQVAGMQGWPPYEKVHPYLSSRSLKWSVQNKVNSINAHACECPAHAP